MGDDMKKHYLLKYKYPHNEKDRLTGETKLEFIHFKHFWSAKERDDYIKSFKKYEKLGRPRIKILEKYEERR